MPIPLGILAVAGAGGGALANDYELITTTITTSSTSSVTFSSLNSYSSTYKHLQIRATIRGGTGSSGGYSLRLRFNGATSTYKEHRLYGNGSGVNSINPSGFSDGIEVLPYLGTTSTANAFAAGVIDILEPFSSSKNTTTRSLGGFHDASGQASNEIALTSGLWTTTDSVSSIYLAPDSGNFAANCRFSLYGIK